MRAEESGLNAVADAKFLAANSSFMMHGSTSTNRRVKRKLHRNQTESAGGDHGDSDEESQVKKVKFDRSADTETKETETGRDSSTPEPNTQICLSATCSG